MVPHPPIFLGRIRMAEIEPFGQSELLIFSITIPLPPSLELFERVNQLPAFPSKPSGRGIVPSAVPGLSEASEALEPSWERSKKPDGTTAGCLDHRPAIAQWWSLPIGQLWRSTAKE
jgi:hypothetical protein